MSDFATRNYFAHGGNELVIGGKLTFLPGATVEGAEGLFDSSSCASSPAVSIPYLPDSTATSAAALRADFNSLLAALRNAGLMASNPDMSAETAAE